MKVTKSLVYKQEANRLICRFGIFNSIEIIFERQEFEKAASDYEYFLSKFMPVILREQVEVYDIASEKDSYIKEIFQTLLSFGLISDTSETYKEETAYLLSSTLEGSELSLSNDQVIKIDHLLKDIDISKFLSNSNKLYNEKILSRNYTHLENKNIFVIFGDYDLLKLRALNRIFYAKGITWTLGLVDGDFLTLTAFDSDYSGCFECFEQNEWVRVSDLKSLLNFYNTAKEYRVAQNSEDIPTKVKYLLETYHLILANTRKIENGVLDVLGKIYSVYTPTFETRIDELYRMPTCECCGVKSIEKTTEYGLNTQKIILELLGE